MNATYTIMTKYFNNLDLKYISSEDFLKIFELNEHDASIELLNYINMMAKTYIPGSDRAFLLLKSSCMLKSILADAQFSLDEIEGIKKKSTKVKNLIISLKEIEPTKSRKHHISKSYNIFDKLHFKLDKSEEKIYDRLKKFIKNRVSVDYIVDYIKDYSSWNEEVNGGNTIYDYIIEETINLFPLDDNNYDIYYFMKLLKALRKKAIILNDGYIKKINKLRNGKISKKEDILLLEMTYIIEGEDYELSETEIDNKYGKKKLSPLEKEYFTHLILPGFKKTEDLRVITIDPSMSSLKDDGLSIRRDGNDYLLGIHISNVSDQVEEGSIVDCVARQNFKTYYEGTYKVYDMIDSRFSMPLFSLEEGKHAPTLSLYVRISNTGEIKEYYFTFDEVNIFKSLTYEDADKILTFGDEYGLYNDLTQLLEVTELLKPSNKGDKYRLIKDLISNTPNPEYAFSTHSIIMETMVLYNHLMAKTFFEDDDAPFIYRIHTEPTDEDLIKVIDILTSGDEKISKGKAKNDLISKVRELYPSAHYSTNNLGHHGLGLSSYAHSTSPGRRYPDLVSQRLYKELFASTRTIQKIEKYHKLCEEYTKLYNLESKIQAAYYKELSLVNRKKDKSFN